MLENVDELKKTPLARLHPKSIWPLYLTQIFHSAAFIGGQSWLMIYIYQNVETPSYSNDQITSYFFIIGIVVSSMLGGLLGDFILGSKRAIQLGALLQIIGAILITISFPTFLNSGVILMVSGAGLFAPNFYAHFGKVYLQIKGKIDSGFTLLHGLTLFSVVLANMLIFPIGERHELLAFGLIILLSTITFVFTFFLTEDVQPDHILRTKSNTAQLSIVVFAFLIMAAYWGFSEKSIEMNQLHMNKATRDYHFLNWKPIVVILFSLPLAYLWMKSQLSTSIKFGIGAGLTFLSIYLLNTFSADVGEHPLRWLIPTVIIWAFAEALLLPAFHSLIAQTVNPKYLGTVNSFTTLANRIMAVGGMLFIWYFFLLK